MQVERLRSDALFRANRKVLADAERFEADLDEGQAIDGLIQPREGLLLYTLARRAAAIGDIVEIGAYKGRSTWYLARGLEDAGSPYRVISIDPHEAHEQRAAYFETLDRHGLRARVEPRVAFSHDVRDEVAGPLGMVWIDGDHSYEAVRQDFDDWFPKLAAGGWYAMHDTVGAHPGTTRLARELLARRDDLGDIGIVWLILFARKTPPSAANRAAALAGRAKLDLLTGMQAGRSRLRRLAAAPAGARR
jgi:predicted O-methyltransferase YrrM